MRPEASLADLYLQTRQQTLALCAPLDRDDYGAQSCFEASPVKWHLGHTSWFFERFVLNHSSGALWDLIFNSYYEQIGPFFDKAARGSLTRPTLEEILRYRQYVDEAILDLLGGSDVNPSAVGVIRTGIEHEKQHQELLLTDIKHLFWVNPFRPAYLPGRAISESSQVSPKNQWIHYDGGVSQLGHTGEEFRYDNEAPRHTVHLEPFALGRQPVTNGEFLEFIEAAGYEKPEHWLSDGWVTARSQRWSAPLYWERQASGWWQHSLSGMRPVNEKEPVAHVSFYEADAFARWRGAALPTEAEWEHAMSNARREGNLLGAALFHPTAEPFAPVGTEDEHERVYGDVWEWTQSAYHPYPGYRPPDGALGEYNGKFMINRQVLRGGSCVTPNDHVRLTYRNFFEPATRWQFSGFRLATRGAHDST